jgi:hypothetical protein
MDLFGGDFGPCCASRRNAPVSDDVWLIMSNGQMPTSLLQDFSP